MRQGSPLAPRAIQVQNGSDHFARIGGSGVSSWLGGRDQRFEDPPLVVGYIDLFTSLFPLFLFLSCITWQLSSPSRSPSPFIGLILSHLPSQAFAHSLLQ